MYSGFANRMEGGGAVSAWEIALAVAPLAPLLADTATDVALVLDYWSRGLRHWSLATLLLVLIAALLVHAFSLRWHVADNHATPLHWITHLTLMGLFHRYTTIVMTAIEAKASKSTRDLHRMRLQQSDMCMLHLFESFLEAAPQLVLQLYIMVTSREWQAFTVISALASLMSLSWAIVNYLRALRQARTDKVCVSGPGLVLQVVWRGALLLTRVSALLLFAVGFHYWVFVLFGLHWLVMTIWVISQKTDFCPSRPEELFYNCIVGVIYCFCFFNLKEGQARYRMFAFYTVMIVENIACIVLFLFFSDPDPIKQELTIIILGIVIGGTIIGICSMLVFYRWFHPSGPIKWLEKRTETQKENTDVQVESPPNNKTSNDASNYTLRSLKTPWVDAVDNPIKEEGVCLENSPQSEAECTDKKLLLDHWIARAGSPTFASAPIDKNDSAEVTGVEFYSVTNTPEKFSRSHGDINGIANTSFQIENEPMDMKKLDEDMTKNQLRNKRRAICAPVDLEMKYSTLERDQLCMKDLTNIEISNKKRRGICSSSQLEEVNAKQRVLDDIVDNLKSVSEISSKSSHERQNSSNDKTSSDSINLDLDLSFSDINSSDINEFNENIVQKLCLSTLKNIKNVHQDADIQNIQRIALEILKDLYSKGSGLKDDQDLESELSSCVGRDLETPSEVLSTHDYENICAVNIAREAWGLRSWRACADMGASPPPPPLPARRNAPIPHMTRDQYISTVAYELARCEENDCQHSENTEYRKDPDSTVFIAKPYVIDQNGGMIPLATTPLEPILEEIDEIIDSNTIRKRQRHGSESALVATIDEIRHDSSTNSPRNVYHRVDWDSPLPDLIESRTHKVESRSLQPSLRRSLWKGSLLPDDKISPNNCSDSKVPSKNSYSSQAYRNTKPNVTSTESMNKFNKTYNNSIETKIKNITSINHKQLKNSDANKLIKSNVRKNDTLHVEGQIKLEGLKISPKIKRDDGQEHNLSLEEVVFLSQLVTDSESFLFKKSSNTVSTDDLSNLGISSSLQSLIDKDNHGALPPSKVFDSRSNVKRSGNKPRRKFSLLREKFEMKSKHSDEEMLFQSLESIKSVSQNNLDITSSLNVSNHNSSVVVVNQEPKLNIDKENLTPSIKVSNNTSTSSKEQGEVVLSLSPCDNLPANSSALNLKEKRNIFLKQVLSPPKINSWNKKS